MNISGQVPSVTVGGRTFTNISGLKIIGAPCTTGNYSTLRSGTGTAYQVPVGKVFVLQAIKAIQDDGAAAKASVVLMYGDDNVGISNAAGPANIVYLFGSNSNAAVCTQSGVNYDQGQNALEFRVPAGKYISFLSAGVLQTVYAYGYEVDA